MSDSPSYLHVASEILTLLSKSGLSKADQKKAMGHVALEFSMRLSPIGVALQRDARAHVSGAKDAANRAPSGAKQSGKKAKAKKPTPPSSSVDSKVDGTEKEVKPNPPARPRAAHNLDPEVLLAESHVKEVRKVLVSLLKDKNLKKDDPVVVDQHKLLEDRIAVYKAAKEAAKSRIGGGVQDPK